MSIALKWLVPVIVAAGLWFSPVFKVDPEPPPVVNGGGCETGPMIDPDGCPKH